MERIEERLIKKIYTLSRSYTPEWRFSEEEPDVGSALALSFAHGLADTNKRFGRIREKNRAAFADATGAWVLPAESAEGYAVFSLSGADVSGSLLPEGTELFADDDEGGNIRCETTEDVFVVSADCDRIFQTVDERDEIELIYDNSRQGFSVFSSGKNNLQRHLLLLSEERALNISSHGEIMIALFDDHGRPVSDEWLERLSDPSMCAWEYGTEEGYVPFEEIFFKDGQLVLKKTDKMPPSLSGSEDGQEGRWLRLSLISSGKFFPFSFSKIRLYGRGSQIYPEMIVGGGLECPHNRFMPFGERLDLYSDVYFGSDEVLGKAGSNVRLKFRVDFRRQVFGERGAGTKWEWIMRKEDFVTDEHTDVAIERVIWEYFNGNGWTSLFISGEHSRDFSLEMAGGRMVELRFNCPDDMAPVLVSSQEIRFIRARIVSISNLYKPEGSYILPVVSEPLFEYEYTGKGLIPSHMIFENNLEKKHLSGKEISKAEKILPFVKTDTKGIGLYFHFLYPPIGSPLRVLFELSSEQLDYKRQLFWEYLTDKGWCSLHAIDETNGLTRTGLLTFGCYDDIIQKSLFGEEGYWIRAVCEAVPTKPVFVKNCFINSTRIVSKSERRQENFAAWQIGSDNRLKLGTVNIDEVCVYVDEQGFLSREEEIRLLGEGRLLQEKDDLGLVRQSWVQWCRVDDFSQSSSGDRHYQLFAADGVICFGDGRHGMVPALGQNRGIRVSYVSVFGSISNLAADRLSRMGRSIGFVNRVTNPIALSGGSNAQSSEEAIKSHSTLFRHQNRALCAHDFKQLLKSYLRSVADVYIIRGLDKNAIPRPGYVTLVILPEIKYGHTQFPKIKKQIKEFLKDKISPVLGSEGRLSIRMPDFVKTCVNVRIFVEDYDLVSKVERMVLIKLGEYLDYTHWNIGTLPTEADFKNTLFSVPGVIGISELEIKLFIGDVLQDYEEIADSPFVLPSNGTHKIQIVVRLSDD